MSKIKTPEPETQDLREFLRVLVNHRKIILTGTAVIFILSLFYALFWPKTFESVVTVKVPESTASTQNAIRQLAFLPSTGDPIETYVEVAQSYTIALYVIDKLDLYHQPQFEGLTEQKLVKKLLKKIVEILNEKQSNIINIDVKAGTPRLASDIANAWADGFIRLNLDLSRQSATARYQFIHSQLQEMKTKLDEDQSVKKNYLNPSNEAMTNEIVYRMLLQEDQEAKIAQSSED